MRTYTVILTPDLEEGGFSAAVPAVPGAHTQGETIEEALANAIDVVRTIIEEMEAQGEAVPEEVAVPRLETVTV